MDERALKILCDTYWSPVGWPVGWKDKHRQKVAPADFAYAKAAGVMFDPVKLHHDEVLQRLTEARDALESRQVADAFLASLSTRRLHLRSALGSYAVFRHLTQHKAVRSERQCTVCGQYPPASQEDLSVLNFERFKWGGVRHDDPLYAMFDLELFGRGEPVSPTLEDIDIFRNLIEAMRTAPSTTTAATLHRLWTGVLKSNKDERDCIIAILGFCGILETAEHHGYRDRFIPNDERGLPDRHFVDMAHPACWWAAKDGINEQALHEWFGHVL